MSKYVKYVCTACGVNTFATEKENVINMALINKMCTPCIRGIIKKAVGE